MWQMTKRGYGFQKAVLSTTYLIKKQKERQIGR